MSLVLPVWLNDLHSGRSENVWQKKTNLGVPRNASSRYASCVIAEPRSHELLDRVYAFSGE